MAGPKKEKPIIDQKPPFFKSWKSIYLLVMAVFGLLVGLFYLFTKVFS